MVDTRTSAKNRSISKDRETAKALTSIVFLVEEKILMKKRVKAKGATSHLKARKRKHPQLEKAERELIRKMTVMNKMETLAAVIPKTVPAQPPVQAMAKTQMATARQVKTAFQKRLPGISSRWNGCAALSYRRRKSWSAHKGIFLRISRASWRSFASQNCLGGTCFGSSSQAAMAARAAGCLQREDILRGSSICPPIGTTE